MAAPTVVTNDADALYQAILARRDDDLPRLVYADWLEENGRPDMAAFIRVQCELARVPWGDPLRIFCEYVEPRWKSGPPDYPLPSLPDGFRWASRPFRRGFPNRVEMSYGAERLEEVLRAVPVDHLVVSVEPAEYASLAGQRSLKALRALELSCNYYLGEDDLRTLLASPHLAQITDLRVEGLTLTPGMLKAICDAPFASRLRTLRLYSCSTGRDVRPPLETRGWCPMPDLEHLHFGWDGYLSEGTVRGILSAVAPRSLKRLGIPYLHNPPSAGAGLLADWPGRTEITHLDVSVTNSWTNLSFMGHCQFPNIKVLRLTPRSIFRECEARHLTDSDWLLRLRVLDIDRCTSADGVIRGLAASGAVRNLHVLNLLIARGVGMEPQIWYEGDGELTDVSVRALHDSPHFESLWRLNVKGRGLDKGLCQQMADRYRPPAEFPVWPFAT